MKVDLQKINAAAKQDPDYWKEARKRSITRSTQQRSLKIAFLVLDFLEETGMTRKALAERMDTSPQQLGRMLKGKTNFTFDTIARLESATGLKLIEIPVQTNSRKFRCNFNFDKVVSGCFQVLGFSDAAGNRTDDQILKLA